MSNHLKGTKTEREKLLLDIKEITLDIYKFDKEFNKRLNNLKILTPDSKFDNLKDCVYVLNQFISDTRIFMKKNEDLVSILFKLLINSLPEYEIELLKELFEEKILRNNTSFR